MGKSHSVNADQVNVRRSPKRLIFQGECGEQFYVSLKDWPALKAAIENCIHEAQNQPATNCKNCAAPLAVSGAACSYCGTRIITREKSIYLDLQAMLAEV